MRVHLQLVVLATFLLSLGQVASADPLLIQGNPDNRPVTITLTPEQASLGEVVFYYESKGNMSVPVYAAMNGPAGLRATVEALPMKRMSAQEALTTSSGWTQLDMDRPLVIRTSSRLLHQTAAMEGYDCHNLNPAVRAQLELVLSYVLGHTPTEEEICTYLGPTISSGGGGDNFNPGGNSELPIPPPQAGAPDFTSSEGDGYVQARAVLHKDTCGGKKGDRYLVRGMVNLSGVDPAVRQAGFNLTFTYSSKNYAGGTAASIKPVSDGQFAPNPLILMDALGGYGDNIDTVYVYKWKNGRGRLVGKKRTEDYAFYQGHILTRIIANGLLVGGKATFELTNGYSLYSVCMRAVRARQRVNGYPG